MFGVHVQGGSGGEIQKSVFANNGVGTLRRETGCTMSCSGNVAHVAHVPSKGIPGFKFIQTGSNSSAFATKVPPKAKAVKVPPPTKAPKVIPTSLTSIPAKQ